MGATRLVEWWVRLEWSLRTAWSGLLIGLIYEVPAIRDYLVFGSISLETAVTFGAFTTIMVADITLGKTLANSAQCLVVSLPVVLSCSLVNYLVSLAYDDIHQARINLPLLAVWCFSFNLLNLPDMAKKLALSIIVGQYATIQTALGWQSVLLLYLHIFFGIVAAVLSRLLPWPRLASRELNSRQLYISHSLQVIWANLFAGLRGEQNACGPVGAVLRSHWIERATHDLRICEQRSAESKWGFWRAPSGPNSRLSDALQLRALDELLLQTQFVIGAFTQKENDARSAHDGASSQEDGAGHAGVGRRSARLLRSMERRVLELAEGAQGELEGAISEAMRHLAQPTLPPEKRAALIRRLDEASASFSASYLKARMTVYYAPDSPPFDAAAIINNNTFIFTLESAVKALRRTLASTEDADEAAAQKVRLVAADVWPSQRHMLRYLRMPCDGLGSLADGDRLLLVQSLKLAASITCAATYGFYGSSWAVTIVPAFTIAYIGTSPVSGANITALLLRALGTILAVVVGVITSSATSTWPTAAAGYFSLAICVLTLPAATWFRSNPDVSYAGTTAGFTLALLLFQRPDTIAQIASQRVVDTLIGVGIHLGFELLVLPMSSMVLLRGAIAKAIRGVRTTHTAALVDLRATILRPLRTEGESGPKEAPSYELATFSAALASIDAQFGLALNCKREPHLAHYVKFTSSSAPEAAAGICRAEDRGRRSDVAERSNEGQQRRHSTVSGTSCDRRSEPVAAAAAAHHLNIDVSSTISGAALRRRWRRAVHSVSEVRERAGFEPAGFVAASPGAISSSHMLHVIAAEEELLLAAARSAVVVKYAVAALQLVAAAEDQPRSDGLLEPLLARYDEETHTAIACFDLWLSIIEGKELDVFQCDALFTWSGRQRQREARAVMRTRLMAAIRLQQRLHQQQHKIVSNVELEVACAFVSSFDQFVDAIERMDAALVEALIAADTEQVPHEDFLLDVTRSWKNVLVLHRWRYQ